MDIFHHAGNSGKTEPRHNIGMDTQYRKYSCNILWSKEKEILSCFARSNTTKGKTSCQCCSPTDKTP